MTHPLGYYVDASPAISSLILKYGEFLEQMSVPEKLLTISILSNTLFVALNDPSADFTINYEIRNRLNRGDYVSESLHTSLVFLDICTHQQIVRLIGAIVSYLPGSSPDSPPG